MSLIYELDEQTRVAEIAMDDGKANVMSTRWFGELEGFLDRAEKDEVTAVVFRGREGMFSGGLDMKWLPTLDAAGGRQLVESFSGAMLRVFTFPIPTVAAVTGHAVAGGCVLASACDYRIAALGPFRIQMNEMLVGMAMPTWAAVICQEAWPASRASDLLLLARAFSPEEAHAAGVVHELCDDAEAVARRAREVAAGMAAIGRAPYALTKKRLRQGAADRARALLFDE